MTRQTLLPAPEAAPVAPAASHVSSEFAVDVTGSASAEGNCVVRRPCLTEPDPAGNDTSSLRPSPNWIGHRPTAARHCAGVQPNKLTSSEARAIREERAAGKSATQIAAERGITNSLVCQICTGRIWKNAGGPLFRLYENAETLAERIAVFAIPGANPDDCYGWDGRLDRDGYPRVDYKGKSLPAHHCSLEIKLGRKLNQGEVSRHTCHNRSCTNQRHLIPGTKLDNARDMVEAGRSLYGERAPSHALTAAQVAELREKSATGSVNYSEEGRRLGVTGNCIANAIKGRAWKHVPRPSASNDNFRATPSPGSQSSDSPSLPGERRAVCGGPR